MEEIPHILQEKGWQLHPQPVYFLGIDISWLVMEEAFISPYDQKPYALEEAMQMELSGLHQIAQRKAA